MEVINGSDLALLLKKKGIKQKTICEKLNIDQSLVSKYYNDVFTMPAPFLLKVAALAGLEMNDLVKLEKQKPDTIKEPEAIYKKKEKEDLINIEMLINGTSVSDYLSKIEQRLADMERTIQDMEKKSIKVNEPELEHV